MRRCASFPTRSVSSEVLVAHSKLHSTHEVVWPESEITIDSLHNLCFAYAELRDRMNLFPLSHLGPSLDPLAFCQYP